ncbi:MAG TPA: lysine--tRNA ligase [Candidatus Paceibacterota bacterium]
MASKQEIIDARIPKLELLKQAGMNPYQAHTDMTHTLAEVIEQFSTLESSQDIVVLAGRVVAIRGQGGILFVVLSDGTAQFQAVLKKDEIEEQVFDLFVNTVDTSDFIEVTGTVFVTKRGEQSLMISNWNMLTKSLMPLPDSWYGLADQEEQLRKRYLSLAIDPEMRAMFARRSKFWNVTRQFFLDKNFTEVETPTLEVTTGGAEANPFKTHHKDYDVDVYLRISVGELWQKRLMAGMLPKTFEIGRVYRNEGSSPDHLQEFTNLEYYEAYSDYKKGMKVVRDLYLKLAQEVWGTTQFESKGHTFNLADEWVELDYAEEVQKRTGINIFDDADEIILEKLKELGVKFDGTTRERMIDSLWKYCRKQISGPAFLVHHPVLVSPLSKRLESDPRKTERFQPIIAGTEVGNGFSELNDPIDQRARFEEQQQLIERGDDEAMMPEWEFVDMLEYGMPPTCGFGFGERLFAILEGKTLRDVTLFPLVKQKIEE